MKRYRSSHSISGVFVFLLLGLFALFSTIMVLLGAQAYHRASSRSGIHNSARISSSYLRSMLRAGDEEQVISVEHLPVSAEEKTEKTPEGELDAILLSNMYDGETYLTRIYVYDGFLREWFSTASAPLHLSGGEIVCEADEMKASLDGNLLQAEIRSGDEWTSVYLALRTDQDS